MKQDFLKLPKLQILKLRSNKFTKFSPSASLENLTELDLQQNPIKKIDFSNLPNLEKLNLRSTKLTHFAPTPTLVKLTDLNLASTPL